ncbi:MAG: PDZ domain-containing protein [Gammaproteobacteria bacterium]|nr:PDZ domain-containing protein [Gammaproteobacteria bacterium]
MNRFKSILQVVSWPIVCGILAGIGYLQYQQLQQIQLVLERNDQMASVAEDIPDSYAEAIKKAAPSVVAINATRVNVESVERTADDQLNLYLGERPSLGSGIIVDARGYILTNLHVVDTLFDTFDTEVTLYDGRKTPATVIAWDETSDLAVLHINMDNLPPIPTSDPQHLAVGDIVFAIGYPRNIGQSVSQGIVSALSRNDEGLISSIQTDAAINPGNSGGALIDSLGRMVGINSSIISESGTSEGIGFATPTDSAIGILRDMVEQAIEANSGYLGVVTGEALNSESSQVFFGVHHIRGMLVERVDEGGPAMRAGIKPGDVITRVGNVSGIDAQNIMLEVRNKKPGETVLIEVYREGQAITLPTTLGFGQAIVIDL